MPEGECFQIGILSERSGVNIETIRYYERVDLLTKPQRSTAGYRLYRTTDSDRLRFIRRARDLGFSLDEVRRLLGLADQKSRSCRRVHDIAVEHLAEVRAKIGDLRRMERVLTAMVKACSQGTMPACPLLETLAQAG
ncbi:MAG: helix-turn-helix domain-containing protein [Reyranella sp.]|nr:helix-turn-helix domain-containing protein [Reyranella sp.]MDP3161954.1 helix-turn-helix domain-containing protein [Reyranella sp.]